MRILVASTVLILAQTASVLEEQARLNSHNGALWKRLGEERLERGNFEAVRESIARRLTVLSDAEVTVQLQRLLASIGDGQEHRWRREPRQG